jgi:Rne/Rng family ribonuclease
MGKNLVISEEANLAALMDRGKAIEFFFQGTGFAVGDIYTARVENILPSIDAVFVSLGTEKMGFLHASDIPGSGPLSQRVWPKQKLLVQIVKEPTGNKGPRVSTDITLIGRFFVLTTENDNIVMSRRISSPNERARLKSIASLLKPPVGFGLVIRTEAMGATEKELEEDFRDLFLERWKFVIDQFEAQRRPCPILSDSKDLLYRVLRDVFHDGVDSVAVDNPKAAERAKHYLELWSHNPPQVVEQPAKQLLKNFGVMDELKIALAHKIELPSGGYLHIQPTEAMTVVDVNSGKFTSSSTPGETVLKTNLEAATEAARQLRLRNIGGVIVIDFIDMDNKYDRLTLLEHFEKLLETDPAHPQIGRLSDLGLVELTRHRQEKSLFESLGQHCSQCNGVGWVFPIFDLFENTNEHSNHSHHHEQGFESQTSYSQAEPSNQFEHINESPERMPVPYQEQPFNQQQRPPQQQQFGRERERVDNRGGDRNNNDRGRRYPKRSMKGPRYNQGPNDRPRGQQREQYPSKVSELEDALVRPMVEVSSQVSELEDKVDIIPAFIPSASNEMPVVQPRQREEHTPFVKPNIVPNHRQEEAPPQKQELRKQEIVLPTLHLEDKTKEVLPGIYSFSIGDDQEES